MKYYFILGNNPALSLAEIVAVFPEAARGELAGEDIFLMEAPEFDAARQIRRMGGVIKIGKITDQIGGAAEALKEKILVAIAARRGAGKINFGISNYGVQSVKEKFLGLAAKAELKQQSVSARFVVSRERVLSSVVVEQNKLVSSGLEFALIPGGKNILIGETLAVQPFKELSRRDYGRPAKDDFSGMLPPKLAQIMINLAQAKKDAVMLDPFCGSGTILTEAMLMGYRQFIGSDISAKAIDDTSKNIEWLKNNYQLPNINYQLSVSAAADLSKIIRPESVDLIVTEPYLGPQRGHRDWLEIKKELDGLYARALAEFRKILKPGGRAVMVWPVLAKKYFLSPSLGGLKKTEVLPAKFQNHPAIKLTERKTVMYGRPGQQVWREIVVFKK